jgi:hypothetical protein
MFTRAIDNSPRSILWRIATGRLSLHKAESPDELAFEERPRRRFGGTRIRGSLGSPGGTAGRNDS